MKAEWTADVILILICLLLRFSDPTYIWTKGRVYLGFKKSWFSYLFWLPTIISFIIVFITYLLRPGLSKPNGAWMLYPTLSYSQLQEYMHCPLLSVTSPQPAPGDTESREVRIDTTTSGACFGSASKWVRSEYLLMGGLPYILGQHFCSPDHFLQLMQQLQVARKMSWLWHMCSGVPGHATLLLFLYQPGSIKQGSYIQWLAQSGVRGTGHLRFGLELDHSTIRYTCNDLQTKQFTAVLLINKAKLHFWREHAWGKISVEGKALKQQETFLLQFSTSGPPTRR